MICSILVGFVLILFPYIGPSLLWAGGAVCQIKEWRKETCFTAFFDHLPTRDTTEDEKILTAKEQIDFKHFLQQIGHRKSELPSGSTRLVCVKKSSGGIGGYVEFSEEMRVKVVDYKECVWDKKGLCRNASLSSPAKYCWVNVIHDFINHHHDHGDFYGESEIVEELVQALTSRLRTQITTKRLFGMFACERNSQVVYGTAGNEMVSRPLTADLFLKLFNSAVQEWRSAGISVSSFQLLGNMPFINFGRHFSLYGEEAKRRTKYSQQANVRTEIKVVGHEEFMLEQWSLERRELQRRQKGGNKLTRKYLLGVRQPSVNRVGTQEGADILGWIVYNQVMLDVVEANASLLRIPIHFGEGTHLVIDRLCLAASHFQHKVSEIYRPLLCPDLDSASQRGRQNMGGPSVDVDLETLSHRMLDGLLAAAEQHPTPQQYPIIGIALPSASVPRLNWGEENRRRAIQQLLIARGGLEVTGAAESDIVTDFAGLLIIRTDTLRSKRRLVTQARALNSILE